MVLDLACRWRRGVPGPGARKLERIVVVSIHLKFGSTEAGRGVEAKRCAPLFDSLVPRVVVQAGPSCVDTQQCPVQVHWMITSMKMLVANSLLSLCSGVVRAA